jgi:hypothetical protein
VRALSLSALLVLTAGPLLAQTTARPPLPNDSLAIARRYAAWTWSSQVDSLLAHSPAAERTADNRQQMVDDIAQMKARAGNEMTLVEERWVRRNGNRQYWRVAMFSDFIDEPVVLRIVIAPNGEMIGMGLNPLSRVPPIDPEP